MTCTNGPGGGAGEGAAFSSKPGAFSLNRITNEPSNTVWCRAGARRHAAVLIRKTARRQAAALPPPASLRLSAAAPKWRCVLFWRSREGERVEGVRSLTLVVTPHQISLNCDSWHPRLRILETVATYEPSPRLGCCLGKIKRRFRRNPGIFLYFVAWFPHRRSVVCVLFHYLLCRHELSAGCQRGDC